jgi:hypothetical protein
MFAVLGSVMFWIVYGTISFIISAMIAKKADTDMFHVLCGEKFKEDGFIFFLYTIQFCMLMCLWPVVVLIYSIGVISNVFVFTGIKKLFQIIDKKIPTVEIKRKEDE